MDLKWYYYRWNQFDHPFESIYRFKQYLWNRYIDPLIKDYLGCRNLAKLIVRKSLFTYTNQVSINVYDANENIIYEFYKIKLNLDGKINWRFDYKNKILSPIKLFTKINKNEFKSVGELKIALEPSRLTFLPSYTYYFLQLDQKSQNEKYSPIQHIKDWANDNPFLMSFNWSDGIEVGIRSINLTLTILLIRDIDERLFNEHQDYFLDLIKKHDYFLKKHLSLYSSANNHLIAELAGIITLNCAFKINSDKTVEKYTNLLIKVTSQQFFLDGFSREQSTHYFKDVLSLYSIVISMIERFTLDLDINAIKNILSYSKNFLEDLRIGKGHYFDMGDNDDSVIIDDIFDESFNEYESVRSDLLIINHESPIQGYDFRNYLLWGITKDDPIDILKVNPVGRNSCKYYEQSKYLLYHNDKTHILIDYSDLGYKFLGAHGHSDLMSFQLVVDNIPIFIDAGTYQYHNKFINERNYFRGISSHNSLSIDGKNHSKITSNMMWNKITEPKDVKYTKKLEGFSLSGVFTFPRNKVHKRTYEYNENTKELLIIDVLNAKNESHFALYYQINPDCLLKKSNVSNQISITSKIGYAKVFVDVYDHEIDIISGKSMPLLGWYSGRYDCIHEGQTLLVSGKFSGEKTIKTRIGINKRYEN